MTIYRSLHTGGERFACYGCDSFGDMIELAGRYYELDVESTIRKLVSSGLLAAREKILDYDVRQYLERHIQRLQRYANLWAGCRKRLITNDSKEYRALRQKLGVDVQLDADRWLAGPGRFLGGSIRSTVDEALWPCVQNYQSSRYDGGRCIFRGGNWHEVLCVPFEDVPGHIKAFWFLGRDGELEKDTAFQLLRYDYRLKFTARETGTAIDDDIGLAMWYSTAGAHPLFGRNVFVVNNLPLALRLHCLNYLDNTQPIPLVSMYYRDIGHKNAGTEYSIWQHFTRRPLLFISSPGDVETIKHAQAADGMLFFDSAPDKRLRSLTPTGYLQQAQAGMKFWDEALVEALSAMSPLAAEGLFLKINFAPDVKYRFLMQCPATLRTTISPQTAQEITDSTIMVDYMRLNESRDGWRDARTGELISNVVLRTDEIVYFEKPGMSMYYGRLIVQGAEHPFVTKGTDIEANPYKWLRERMVSTGIGLPLVSTRWRKKLLDIAHRFSQPATRVAPARIGWDDASHSFVFPRFFIGPKGVVTKAAAVFGDEWGPGESCVAPDESLTPDEIGLLTKATPFNTLVLSTLDCILHNLIAPIFNANPFGIALAGPGAELSFRIAERLGCIKEHKERYRWPRLVTNAIENWKEQPNGVVIVDDITADVLSCRCWCVLRAKEATADEEVWNMLPRLVPAFLRWLGLLDWRLAGTSTLAERVKAATVRWLNEQANSDKHVNFATRKAAVDVDGEECVNAFLRLVCRFFTNGDLGWVRVDAGKVDPSKHNLLWTGDDLPQVHIPKTSINRLLVNHGAPTLDMSQLSSGLCQTGVFSETTTARVPCLTLRESDWNAHLEDWNTKRK